MTYPHDYDREPIETEYGIPGFRFPLWLLIGLAVGITFLV